MYLRGYETRYGANSDRTTPYNKYIAKLVQKEVTAFNNEQKPIPHGKLFEPPPQKK
jgi:hypothetical protein